MSVLYAISISYLWVGKLLTDLHFRHWLDIANKMHTSSTSFLSTSYMHLTMIMWITTTAPASSTKHFTVNCEARSLATSAAMSRKLKTPWLISVLTYKYKRRNALWAAALVPHLRQRLRAAWKASRHPSASWLMRITAISAVVPPRRPQNSCVSRNYRLFCAYN